MRIAELSIYLPSWSAFWRIQFDWLPSDCKRALSCEMHQDFGANARVPPKSASGRLENASSALSIPNQCPGPPPSLSVHYLCIQSVFIQQNPNLFVILSHLQIIRYSPICKRSYLQSGCFSRRIAIVRLFSLQGFPATSPYTLQT